jgi:hypothetical protein
VTPPGPPGRPGDRAAQPNFEEVAVQLDNSTWAEYHTAGATVLTTVPPTDAGNGANVGAVLVVAFLIAVTVVALGRVLAPLAQLAQALLGATGAVLLTVAGFVLVVILAVT